MLELSTPMRVTWDVGSDSAAISNIIAKLHEGRALFVEALVAGESGALLADNLAGFGAFSPALTVMGDFGALDAFAKGSDRAAKTTGFLLYQGEGSEEVATLADRFKALTLALWSTDEGLQGFGAALEAAKLIGAPLAILNPHAPAQPLSEDASARVAQLWQERGEGVKLTAHDLFLAERMGLDPWKGYKGCAAGSALAHVTSEGLLAACRTLPLVLGDLREESMKALWKDAKRLELRAVLNAPPSGCVGCVRATFCLGGCPGLAEPGVRDRSCAGPVEAN